MNEKEREEKIAFIVWAVHEVEGVEVPAQHFEKKTDAELVEDVSWYEYLLTK